MSKNELNVSSHLISVNNNERSRNNLFLEAKNKRGNSINSNRIQRENNREVPIYNYNNFNIQHNNFFSNNEQNNPQLNKQSNNRMSNNNIGNKNKNLKSLEILDNNYYSSRNACNNQNINHNRYTSPNTKGVLNFIFKEKRNIINSEEKSNNSPKNNTKDFQAIFRNQNLYEDNSRKYNSHKKIKPQRNYRILNRPLNTNEIGFGQTLINLENRQEEKQLQDFWKEQIKEKKIKKEKEKEIEEKIKMEKDREIEIQNINNINKERKKEEENLMHNIMLKENVQNMNYLLIENKNLKSMNENIKQ